MTDPVMGNVRVEPAYRPQSRKFYVTFASESTKVAEALFSLFKDEKKSSQKSKFSLAFCVLDLSEQFWFRVCLSVCLSVCHEFLVTRITIRSYCPISMKFSGIVRVGV